MNQRPLSGEIIRRSLLQSGLAVSGSRVYRFTVAFLADSTLAEIKLNRLDGAEKRTAESRCCVAALRRFLYERAHVRRIFSSYTSVIIHE